MKKIISLFLCTVILAVSLIPAVHADEVKNDNPTVLVPGFLQSYMFIEDENGDRENLFPPEAKNIIVRIMQDLHNFLPALFGLLWGDFENFGYKYADWNALNGDAEMADYTYDHCISRIKETCSDTGDVVILMHDAPLKTMTVATLPETIEYLISQGYSFERIVP